MSKRILIACEESQVITKKFRAKGFEAYSCDIIDCSGGHPEWHLKQDVTPLLKEKWDLIIAHPPCTYLSVSGLHWNKKRPERALKTKEAIEFFMLFTNANSDKIAIENPISCISTHYRKPDQIIQPYQFGDDASKKTCLWLKNLPLLKPTKYIEPRTVNGKKRWSNQTDSGQNKLPPSKDRAKLRSKTYEGIASAIVNQWSVLL